ncbi:MAG TPA: PEGA domain-containing protein [Myxococcota bacterium]|jgi:hypothetical protein|nr:PEGA domain-containing protein [Myxococcota bacterium]
MQRSGFERRLVIGALALGLGVAGLAAAPAPARADEVDDAASVGLTTGGSSCDDAKLAALRKEYDTSKKADLLRDIGKCYEDRGEIGSAIAQYDSYLRAAKSAPDAADVKSRIEALKAKKAADEEKAGKGYLEVKVNIDGAAIAIDGEKKGTSPLKKLPLKSGLYEVGVTAGGYPDWLGTANVTEGNTTTLDVEMEKPRGTPVVPILLGVAGAGLVVGIVVAIVVASNKLKAGSLGAVCIDASDRLCNM